MLAHLTLLSFYLSLTNALLPRGETTATLLTSEPPMETPSIVLRGLSPRLETTETYVSGPIETPSIPLRARGETMATTIEPAPIETPNIFFEDLASLLLALKSAGVVARDETVATIATSDVSSVGTQNVVARGETTATHVPGPIETPSIVLRGLAPRDETVATLPTDDISSIGTQNLVAARATATPTSLPNGAEIESGEGIRRKEVSADFAPKMENGGVGVRGGMAAMIVGLAAAAAMV